MTEIFCGKWQDSVEFSKYLKTSPHLHDEVYSAEFCILCENPVRGIFLMAAEIICNAQYSSDYCPQNSLFN
jgi:hypothetical protein